MKRLLKVVSVVVAMLIMAIASFLIWAYKPVATFSPVDYKPVRPDYWPTKDWRYSTPEEQGVNSEVLVDMMQDHAKSVASDQEFYTDSITVIRNGYIVADIYNNPLYPSDELHVIHSAVKSIISALIGIAIERGHIANVDARLVDIFNQYEIDNLDARKRALSVRDLLSMETGLHSRDSFLYGYEGLFDLQHSEDWIQFALDLPMVATPGERFDYSNISTFILSAIIMETSGMDTLDFAKQHLFEPLGIKNVKWEWNEQHQPIAWARMWMKPHDMAKLGLLFLQQGQWDGKQIIPADWIHDSLTPWAYPKNAVDVLNAETNKDQEASTRNWVAQRFFRSFADGYGYQWWLDRNGSYTALGVGGQYIAVAPDKNLIFIVTSKSSGAAQFKPAKLFHKYVVPATQSDEPLKPNKTAQKELLALSRPVEMLRETMPVSQLPKVAMNVSGMTYKMEDNPFKTDNFRFVFNPEKAYAEISYTARESWSVDYRVGLDGIPRYSETNDSTFVASGNWISPNVFSVDVEIVGYSTFDKWLFEFNDEGIKVTEIGVAGDFVYQGKAQ